MSWNSANTRERSVDAAEDNALIPGEQRGGNECEIGKDHRVLRKVAFAQRLLSLAGEYEDRLRFHCRGALQVANAVADAWNAGEVDAETLADVVRHARLRLSALAGRIGGMRAIEERVDPATDLR